MMLDFSVIFCLNGEVESTGLREISDDNVGYFAFHFCDDRVETDPFTRDTKGYFFPSLDEEFTLLFLLVL